MRLTKRILSIFIVLLIISPKKVLAADHQHEFVMSQSTSKSSSELYCSIITYTTTQSCKCGYKLETKNTEYTPHQWESVCVDIINNGYQRKCKACGRTTGSILYPYSIEIPNTDM